MSDKKEIKEIDVASLDSELAAARTLEEGKGDKFIMMASVVAFLMTSFHIYTGFFGLFDYSVQRGVHLGFALTLILLTQPLYKHVFKDKFAGSKAFRAACRTLERAQRPKQLLVHPDAWPSTFSGKVDLLRLRAWAGERLNPT